jgi:uncharacterized protein YbcI
LQVDRVEDDKRRSSPTLEISNAAVQILRDYTGRGPTKARTYIHDDLVTIVLQDTLTRGERKLVDTGHWERVAELRQEFQTLMRSELIEAVQRHTGREVVAFMSANHEDPDLAVEILVLQPPLAS